MNSRGSVLKRVGATPEKDYAWNFQVARESAKQNNEKATLEALAKMRYTREKAGVTPEGNAENEHAVYASLYEATLQSAKEEIASHIGGGWRNFKQAKDPLIENNFNRNKLFAKLDEYSVKARGVYLLSVDEAKKEIDRSLYSYYQKEALECITKFERGGDIDIDERFEKYISKLKEVGTGSGRAEAEVNEDARKLYSISYVAKYKDIRDYASEHNPFADELAKDPFYGPKMHELARKAGMSERDYETLFRFLCANIGGAGDLLALNEAEFARRIQAKDKELLQKYGRTTTAAERLEIAGGPGLGYQTYSQWRKIRQFVEDPTELYPKMEPFKSYHEWKQSRGQKRK